MKLEEIKNKTKEATDYLVQSLEAGHRRNGERDERSPEGGWQGVSESAVRAKRIWVWFGA